MLIAADETVRKDGFELRYVTFLVEEALQLIYLQARGDGVIEIDENVHPDSFELDITPDGNATIVIEGQEVRSDSSQLVMIHPGARHFGRLEIERLFQGFSLFIGKDILAHRLGEKRRSYSLVADTRGRLQKLFGIISDHFVASTAKELTGEDEFISDILRVLIAELRRSVLSVELPKNLSELVDQIHQQHDKKLSLDDMARIAAVSKYHLIRRFSEIFGKTPVQYLTDVRLQHAVELLKQQPDEAINQIAYAVGFNDVSGFFRHFKRRYNMSPKAFRHQLAEQKGK